jgi:ribosomal-protein-alanine N-acetyltransferase
MTALLAHGIILETERLTLREMEAEGDAAFVFKLLNTPKFIKYIGDRGVRSVDEARHFIESKYRKSYSENGYGLYTVLLKDGRSGETQIGMCGFVRRDSLPGPDIGFAFLPEFEGKGYGYESASAIMDFGCNVLSFDEVFAITSQDNESSGKLLKKLGFRFSRLFESGAETLKLFEVKLHQGNK